LADTMRKNPGVALRQSVDHPMSLSAPSYSLAAFLSPPWPPACKVLLVVEKRTMYPLIVVDVARCVGTP
jgi:hypothetical protein